jgi:integrase
MKRHHLNTGKLTALAVARAKERGTYGDGHGLYLQVARGGSRSWVLRYKVNGRTRCFGIGPLHAVSLAQARERAAEARRLLIDGADPIEARRARRDAARLDAAKTMSFDQCADAYITAHRAGWRNVRHAEQWEKTIATFVSPTIGALPVQAIDTALVLKVIEPLWTAKPETASRLRGRIEAVLDWAKARGFRAGENPARWKGHLDNLLPEKGKVAKVEHHAAMPHAEVAAFLADLRRQEGVAARAVEFIILTAARSGEAIGARWGEIDLANRTWTIPASRMKAGRAHSVPLSPRALDILEALPRREGDGGDDLIFPNGRGKRLGNAILLLVKRMRPAATVHGFRSSFRDWAAEQTNFPSEVAEAALAHVVGNKVVEAYRRTDFFDLRRRLMDAWAIYCAEPPVERGVVVPLRG